MTLSDIIRDELKNYSEAITATFSLPIACNPEDQLKGPMAKFLKSVGKAMGLTVEVATEVHAEGLERPDIGVAVKGLLSGHIELKAPGKGADPTKYKGGDRGQWERFQNLPNLSYTDGNNWALYRNGTRQGNIIRLTGDVTQDGKGAIGENEAEIFLRDFFLWQPIVPAQTDNFLAKLVKISEATSDAGKPGERSRKDRNHHYRPEVIS